MVPEHLLSMPYTHVTSGRVWNLGSVTFVSQSSACGGWIGVLYFSLSCVVFWTGGGLIRSTCLFHNSQLPVPLILFYGSVGCMPKRTLSLTCLPRVDFHCGVCLLGSSDPCRVRLSMFLPVGSTLIPKVDIVLVSYSSAIFTYLVRVGSDHLCSFPMMAPSWPAIFRFLSICAEYPVAPQRGRPDSAILLVVCAWAGIMIVVTTKLHKDVLYWNIPCLWSDSTSSVLSLLWGVQQISQQGFWRSLRAIGILLARLKDDFIWYWRRALGFQWTKYCSWDAGICQLPWALAFFWSGSFASYFVTLSNSNIWFTTLDAPDLFARFFAYSLLYCQSMSVECWLMMDRSYDPSLPLHQLLQIRSLFRFVGDCISCSFARGGAEVFWW